MPWWRAEKIAPTPKANCKEMVFVGWPHGDDQGITENQREFPLLAFEGVSPRCSPGPKDWSNLGDENKNGEVFWCSDFIAGIHFLLNHFLVRSGFLPLKPITCSLLAHEFLILSRRRGIESWKKNKAIVSGSGAATPDHLTRKVWGNDIYIFLPGFGSRMWQKMEWLWEPASPHLQDKAVYFFLLSGEILLQGWRDVEGPTRYFFLCPPKTL